MHNFREFKVWKKGIDLAVEIYKITNSFPVEERFGLTAQIRRCTVSISSNFAEGCGRKTDKDLSNFLSISLGSQYELETQLVIANEVGILDSASFDRLLKELNEIQKMTYSLIDKFS